MDAASMQPHLTGTSQDTITQQVTVRPQNKTLGDAEACSQIELLGITSHVISDL